MCSPSSCLASRSPKSPRSKKTWVPKSSRWPARLKMPKAKPATPPPPPTRPTLASPNSRATHRPPLLPLLRKWATSAARSPKFRNPPRPPSRLARAKKLQKNPPSPVRTSMLSSPVTPWPRSLAQMGLRSPRSRPSTLASTPPSFTSARKSSFPPRSKRLLISTSQSPSPYRSGDFFCP